MEISNGVKNLKFPKIQTLGTLAIFLTMLGFLGFLLFYRLGNHPLIDWDEAIYAQVAKESFKNHNQLELTYFSNAWFEKPPVMIWLTETGYKIFGQNEFGARFWVAFFALLTILLTALFIKELSGSFLAVLLGIGSYLIFYQYLQHSYFLNFDIPAAFFILFALYGYFKTYKDSRYFYLLAFALGMGIMVKSAIGLIVLPIIFLDLLWQKKSLVFKRQINKHFWKGCLLFLAITVPWHLFQTLANGKKFWDNYLFFHVFGRYLTTLENHSGPFFYYLPLFFQNKLLALLCAISLLYFAIKLIFARRSQNNYFLPLIAVLVIFLFFSLAKTKRYEYITIIYPFLAIIIGISLSQILKLTKLKIISFLGALIFLAIFIGLGWQQNQFKLLKWEGEQIYLDNKAIAEFVKNQKAGTKVYQNPVALLSGPSLNYYLGYQLQNLPSNLKLPGDFILNPQYRIFHANKKNIYKFNGFLYIDQ